LRENHRLTVRSIAEQENIDRETVRKILTEDLDMRKVCAKIVPKEGCPVSRCNETKIASHLNPILLTPHLLYIYVRSPFTGPEWPRGFQEVKVPRLHDNGTGWW